MPKFRIPYNAEALFVGPSPASGYNFLSSQGRTNVSNGNINLISYLNRVQDVSFEITSPKTNVKAFGKYGHLKTYQTKNSTVNLSFSYLQIGVRNEDKLGLYVNFPKPETSYSGAPIFSNNDQVFLLSGFYTSSQERSDRALGWPLAYRDNKNIFLAINKTDGNDFNNYSTGSPPNTGSNVFAFGNCYLTSYKTEASINSLPTVSVNYIADNLVFYSSGSGMQNPSLAPDGTQYTSICSLPNNYENKKVTALVPSDISLDITSYPSQSSISSLQGTGVASSLNSDIFNHGISYTGIQIQGYSISFDLPRKTIENLIYKIPQNRKLLFPIKANISLNAIVNSFNTGNIYNLFRYEEDYDLNIKISNPTWSRGTGVAVHYKIKKAKLESNSYSSSIGENQSYQINLSTELSPSDLSRGLFISGQYNTDESVSSSGFLLQENGFRILQEDNSGIIIDNSSFLV